jgi:hypothetical protein
MSAFYCGYPHLAELAKALVEVARRNEPLEDLAATLHKENVRSLCARYEDDTPEMYDGEYARLLFELTGPRVVTDPVVLQKMVHCYRYQACEHPEWKESDAFRLMAVLEEALQPLLPELVPSRHGPKFKPEPKGYDKANGWPYEPGYVAQPTVFAPAPDLPLFRSVP